MADIIPGTQTGNEQGQSFSFSSDSPGTGIDTHSNSGGSLQTDKPGSPPPPGDPWKKSYDELSERFSSFEKRVNNFVSQLSQQYQRDDYQEDDYTDYQQGYYQDPRYQQVYHGQRQGYNQHDTFSFFNYMIDQRIARLQAEQEIANNINELKKAIKENPELQANKKEVEDVIVSLGFNHRNIHFLTPDVVNFALEVVQARKLKQGGTPQQRLPGGVSRGNSPVVDRDDHELYLRASATERQFYDLAKKDNPDLTFREWLGE